MASKLTFFWVTLATLPAHIHAPLPTANHNLAMVVQGLETDTVLLNDLFYTAAQMHLLG